MRAFHISSERPFGSLVDGFSQILSGIADVRTEPLRDRPDPVDARLASPPVRRVMVDHDTGECVVAGLGRSEAEELLDALEVAGCERCTVGPVSEAGFTVRWKKRAGD